MFLFKWDYNIRQFNAYYRFCIFYIIFVYLIIYILYKVSHRSEYTPHIFVNIYYIFSCDNTEEMTLCYNVK